MTTPKNIETAGFYSTSDEGVMRQAEVLAMRSLSDQLGILNSSMEGLRGDMKGFSVDVREVREKLITLESSKIEGRLDKEVLRLDKELELSRLERRRIEDATDHECQNLHSRITALAMSYSRFTGTVAPLGALGLVVFTAVVSFIFANLGHH